MKKSIQFIITLTLMFLCVACCREDSAQQKVTLQNAKQRQLGADTPAERRDMALKLIESYPMVDWQNDIIARIAATTGSAVSQEVKHRANKKLGEKDMLEKRIALLVQMYSATELSRLAELYSNEQDRKLLKNITAYDDKLRELVAPLIMEVLSNTP